MVKVNWTVILSLAFIVVVTIISLAMKTFSGWMFAGLVFYGVLFIGAYAYIVLNAERMDKDANLERKQKFEWCWGRVNTILRSFPDGQGLAWVQGVSRQSTLKYFFDGVQNKPYRSMIAKLENTQDDVLIIFDIDNDDVALYTSNISAMQYQDHFYNFNPFAKAGGGSPFDMNNRFDRYGGGGYNRNRGLNIRIGDDERVGDYNRSPPPSEDAISEVAKRI